MPQGFFASLGGFGAVLCTAPKNAVAPRYSICRKCGEQNKLPAGKRGIFYDRADGCFIFGRAVLAAFALGGTGDAAPGGAAAGSGGHRLCRRLGGAVRGADALWLAEESMGVDAMELLSCDTTSSSE